MSAGDVWRCTDGLRWVEVQTAAVDPSGWRLMVPHIGVDDAPDAPPLVVTVGEERARVHLLRAAPCDELGEPAGELRVDDVEILQAAVKRLVAT